MLEDCFSFSLDQFIIVILLFPIISSLLNYILLYKMEAQNLFLTIHIF